MLTRLSDGMGWRIDAEAGEGFTQPVWVDDADVFLATAKIVPQIDRLGDTSTVIRISRATLGPPTVPPGL